MVVWPLIVSTVLLMPSSSQEYPPVAFFSSFKPVKDKESYGKHARRYEIPKPVEVVRKALERQFGPGDRPSHGGFSWNFGAEGSDPRRAGFLRKWAQRNHAGRM